MSETVADETTTDTRMWRVVRGGSTRIDAVWFKDGQEITELIALTRGNYPDEVARAEQIVAEHNRLAEDADLRDIEQVHREALRRLWIYAEDQAEHGRAILPIHLHMRDGSTRTITYDCNTESPFQALERVYRRSDSTDFMVHDVESVTFSGT